MAQTNVPDAEALKQAVKEALVEALQEKRELFHDIFVEVLEEVGLVEAIREGRQSKSATREEVFSVTKDKT